MKLALTIIGVLMMIAGIIWIGQGTGYFPYPASSFMINDTTWTYIGGVCVVVGIALIYFGRCK